MDSTRRIGVVVLWIAAAATAGCSDSKEDEGGGGDDQQMSGAQGNAGGQAANMAAAGQGQAAGSGAPQSPSTGTNAGAAAAQMPSTNAGSEAPQQPQEPMTDGRDPNAVNPYPGFTSEVYADDKMWMCKPGLAKNYCLENIADATEALPGGTYQPFMDDLGTDHPIDCIFWYPTVNRTEDPTSYDFSDPEPMLASIRSQAARFSRVCNVYAPFYRQRSLNNGGDAELGYMDVVESFKQYVANWSEGRSFVIFGHSQGTGHATRLITQEVNDNPDLRSRLVSALLIGGGLTATTFSNIPLCTAPDQFGCAVGYRSYGAPQATDSVTAGLACTNPGALGGGKVLLKGSFFKSRGTNYSQDLGPEFTATWGLFRNLFTAECVDTSSGGQVLRIDYTDDAADMRQHPIDLSVVIGFGLHVFDYQFPLDDLVELVRTQRDAKLAAAP